MKGCGLWEHLVARKRFNLNGISHYFEVFVWGSSKALQLHAEAVLGQCDSPIFGMTIPEEGNGRRLGEIHFSITTWNDKIVAHEIEHATLHVMRVFDIKTNDSIPNEERVCYMHGKLFHQVYRWLWYISEGMMK